MANLWVTDLRVLGSVSRREISAVVVIRVASLFLELDGWNIRAVRRDYIGRFLRARAVGRARDPARGER
jgi:hypothetical protein